MVSRKKTILFALIVLEVILFSNALAQGTKITLAVMDFKNSSGRSRYDRLERAVAEMLKTELSQCREIAVLERKKIEAVLSEYALAQAGYIKTEHAQEVGKLAGAEYIITGEIQRINQELRLDAHLIRVSTGQILGEKVTGKDEQRINPMVQLLARNIIFDLTGKGMRLTEQKVKNYKLPYFAVTSAVLGIVTVGFHADYRSNYDRYRETTDFDEFDRYYDRANRSHKIRNWFMVATAASMITTFTIWRMDKSRDNRVFASNYQSKLGKFAGQINVGIFPSPTSFTFGLTVRF